MVQFTDKPRLSGSVVAVGSNPQHGFSKPIQRTIKLVENHGVEGDAHAGRFVRHRYLAAKTPELLNNRQVHLMASELFAELVSVGFIVSSGDLGENVTTEGLDLTSFPLGTRLRIGDSAIVELTGLRTPCSLIDRFQKGLKRAMIRKNARPRFRCGVLGVVKATGQIAAGDPVAVELPLSAWKALPAL
jgi:MOSC domain-containing protein YiiM